jgi:hypothetical protein
MAFRAMLIVASVVAASCGDEAPRWELVQEDLPGALLSVWGTSSEDVWAVGGDARDGTGPTVLHFDGDEWARVETGLSAGSLWWVFGFEGGPIYMGGEGGLILRYDGSTFEPMDTPGTSTVFGIWGSSPSDVWAVGGAPGTEGFVWRLRGDGWEPEPSLPTDIASSSAIWKVYGTGPTDVWLVGENGVALHYEGSTLSPDDTGVGASLFTVHESEGRFAAVGGIADGVIVELEDDGWHNVTPTGGLVPGLSGVCMGSGEFGVAVGLYGAVFTRGSDGWSEVDLGFYLDQNLHGAWIDPDGGVWAVGGQTSSPTLNEGVLIHRTAAP